MKHLYTVYIVVKLSLTLALLSKFFEIITSIDLIIFT